MRQPDFIPVRAIRDQYALLEELHARASEPEDLDRRHAISAWMLGLRSLANTLGFSLDPAHTDEELTQVDRELDTEMEYFTKTLKLLLILAQSVQEHPHYSEMCRITDERDRPDHPGTKLRHALDSLEIDALTEGAITALINANTWLTDHAS